MVIGKWVLAGARFLLLYDPTRGVDVATKFEIYKLIQALADEGCSMLVYSSDLTEVVGLCDRVLTFYRSRVTGEFAATSSPRPMCWARSSAPPGGAAA